MPFWVSGTASAARAMPKSVIFTAPSDRRTSRLPGFTSRCTIPTRCASASASAACRTISSTRAGRQPPVPGQLGRQRLAVDVLHDQVRDRDVVAGGHLAVVEDVGDAVGCSDAVVRASVRNRSRNVRSWVSSLLSTFTATVRDSTVSSARQTSPMPPIAIRRSSR